MARPKAKELTERELEIMHIFWDSGAGTAAQVRDQLESNGRELAYTTVATLIRILCEKSFLKQSTTERPFQYKPVRTFDDVSSSLVSDLVQKVFSGSRDQMMVQLLGKKKLTAKERATLEKILKEQSK